MSFFSSYTGSSDTKGHEQIRRIKTQTTENEDASNLVGQQSQQNQEITHPAAQIFKKERLFQQFQVQSLERDSYTFTRDSENYLVWSAVDHKAQ